MKKLTSTILIILLAFSLVACKKENSSPTKEEQPPVYTYYILNKNSYVYHRPDCSYLPYKENQIKIDKYDVKSHYNPCGHCKP